MKSKPIYRTIEDVRDLALETLGKLQANEIDAKQATEIANLIGKATATVKAQLVYHMLRKERPDIAFMNCAHAIPIEAAPVSISGTARKRKAA